MDGVPNPSPRIALAFHGFAGGGLELSMLRLASGLKSSGCVVDFVVKQRSGEFADRLPAGMTVHEIGISPTDTAPRNNGKGRRKAKKLWRNMLLRAQLASTNLLDLRLLLGRDMKALDPLDFPQVFPGLVRYLRRHRPDAVLAAEPHFNAMAALARRVAGTKNRVVVSDWIQPSLHIQGQGLWKNADLNGLLRRAYKSADAIVAISDGVAEDLSERSGISRAHMTTIYNPVVEPELLELAQEPIDHPWFAEDQPPVILGVGRLHPQKDFPTLIAAFKRLREKRPARLVILGEGGPDPGQSRREEIEQLARRLGIADEVSMPGFTSNPFAFMSKADVFVLSSAYEGLGNVLIEAMACGCTVVSTDCPSGPREILEDGRYGPLVRVGDIEGLAEAIGRVLDQPTDKDELKSRANMFTVERATRKYLDLLCMRRKGPFVESQYNF